MQTLPFVIKVFVLSIFEGPFYIGFIVLNSSIWFDTIVTRTCDDYQGVTYQNVPIKLYFSPYILSNSAVLTSLFTRLVIFVFSQNHSFNPLLHRLFLDHDSILYFKTTLKNSRKK